MGDGVRNVAKDALLWRRDFHRYPELGWTEFRTSARIAEILESFGLEVRIGGDAVRADARRGLPPVTELDAAFHRAQREGASDKYLPAMRGGLTGVVSTLDGAKPGPTVGLRFDIDALPITEVSEQGHLPSREGFASMHPGIMHACGHDGHAAIGLGVAKLLASVREHLSGRVKFLFQPAEEGVRGAQAMIAAGLLDDCDYLLGCHLGLEMKTGGIVAGVNGFLATTKLEAVFSGAEAHAAFRPEQGRNALLAAATAALNIHALPHHSGGLSRVNVGVLQAGTDHNIIPGRALLKLEVRGATAEIHAFFERRVREVLQAAAAMHGVDLETRVVGASPFATSDDLLVDLISDLAAHVEGVDRIDRHFFLQASDDMAAMMLRVQERGGKAAFFIAGSSIPSGHHTPRLISMNDRCLLRSHSSLAPQPSCSLQPDDPRTQPEW